MGFFATFWTWLNSQLATYIGDNTARLSTTLEPAIVTFATIYVMAWGYMHLTGKIEEPFVTGLKRIVTLAVILGLSLRLWLYNTLIVDTFYNAPAQLAAAVVGSTNPVGTIDLIWERGGGVAGVLWIKGSAWPSGFGVREALRAFESSRSVLPEDSYYPSGFASGFEETRADGEKDSGFFHAGFRFARRVIHMDFWGYFGSLPSATARQAMSRSVTTPTSFLFASLSTIGISPQSQAAIAWATS